MGVIASFVPERVPEAPERCPGRADPLDQFEQLPGRAAEPIEPCHHDDVVGHQHGHQLGKLRAISPTVVSASPAGLGVAGRQTRIVPTRNVPIRGPAWPMAIMRVGGEGPKNLKGAREGYCSGQCPIASPGRFHIRRQPLRIAEPSAA